MQRLVHYLMILTLSSVQQVSESNHKMWDAPGTVAWI
jgi:hypothetical protein